jgi:AcrR family transcriptional regulator
MRADARRNRDRLLEAADSVFAERGTSASTEEIARSAGVGVGTLFRHFPTKEDLLRAVFVGRLRRLADEARSLSHAPEPGEALFGFFARAVDRAETKSALADALAEAGVDIGDATAEVGDDLNRALEVLLVRAQRVGAVRDDVRVPDLIGLLVGASRAAEHVHGDRDARARIVGVVLDGLRPPHTAAGAARVPDGGSAT